MSFFVAKNEAVLESVMDPSLLMKAAPDYYRGRFEEIARMREADDGTGHTGQEFRRVASFVNVPLFMAEKMADPTFLKDKRKFYAFIDRNPQYVTYQRRNGGRGTERDKLKLPLSALGLDYPGGPETLEDFDAVALDPVADTNEAGVEPLTPITQDAEVTP